MASSNPAEQVTEGSVTSKDGTIIGYQQYGDHGPGLLLVQGTMGTAYNFVELAKQLANIFTVYVPDRRGRGMSGPSGKSYGIQREVEDLEALLAKTKAHYVFGLSSGAIISLEAALALPAIQKLAIYEPPLFLEGTLPVAYIDRYEKELAEGNLAGALITGMKAGKFGPPIMSLMPRWLLQSMTSRIMKLEEKKGTGGYAPMSVLAYTLHNDFQIVRATSGKIEHFRAVEIEVLLLGGSKSPMYLKIALNELEKVLPHRKRTEFPGLDHGAAWNYDKQRNPHGNPKVVAEALKLFFMSD